METKQSVVEIFFLIVIMGHHMNYLGVYYKLTNSWSSFQALPAFSGIVFKVISNVNWKHFTWWDLNICFPDWRIYQHAIMWLSKIACLIPKQSASSVFWCWDFLWNIFSNHFGQFGTWDSWVKRFELDKNTAGTRNWKKCTKCG